LMPVSALRGLKPQSGARVCAIRPRTQCSSFALCSPLGNVFKPSPPRPRLR
jgi:hypothetical protein